MKFVAIDTQPRRDRPRCTHKIHVQEGLKTRSAQAAAARRKREGIAIDQCGMRSDFTVDGAPTCRTHAAACALAQVLKLGGER